MPNSRKLATAGQQTISDWPERLAKEYIGKDRTDPSGKTG